MDRIRLDDQVVVITGAGSGIGRIYAIEAAKLGAKIVVNDLGGSRDGSSEASRNAADDVVSEIQNFGGIAVANYDSVATSTGGNAIVETALKEFGKIDILINNAGIIRDRSLLKMDENDWDQVMAVHLDAVFHVTKPAFQAMRERRYGRILFTTSAAGLYGNFGQSNYSAAKLGIVGFMNSLKLEGEKYDIKCNAIAPIAATRLTEDILPPQMLELLKPEFMAPLALYLCSKHCTVSGSVYNAAPGHFCRAAIVTGPGKRFDPTQPISVDDIATHFEEISGLHNAVEWKSAVEALGGIFSSWTK